MPMSGILSVWSSERTRRITPETLDAVFAALIEAARAYPHATIKVGYAPYGVEVEAFDTAIYDPGNLLFRRAWLYDYPE